MLDRLAQRFRIHHADPLSRAIKASRSCIAVGIEVKTSSPSMTMEGSVNTPSSTARSRFSTAFTSCHSRSLTACRAADCSSARAPTHAGQPGAWKTSTFITSLHSRFRAIGPLQGGDNRAFLHRLGFIGAVGDQVIERLGHHLHRANLAFDLQFLFDRSRPDVAAAGLVATTHDKKIADFGEGETALLGVLDEMNTPGGILVIQPVARRAFPGWLNQPLCLVIA